MQRSEMICLKGVTKVTNKLLKNSFFDQNPTANGKRKPSKSNPKVGSFDFGREPIANEYTSDGQACNSK